MSDPGRDTRAPGASPKIDSETLALRARPQRVARFNRRVVIGVAAGACILVFAATMVALYPPSVNRSRSDTELLNTDRKQVADGLAALPRGYGDLAPKPPKLGPPLPDDLGPPLPGDLGPPVAHVEQNLGVTPPPAQNFGLRPNPEEDAARAERMRLARQAQEALESKVFFPVSVRPGQTVGAKADVGSGVGGAVAASTSETAIGVTPARLSLDQDRDPNNQQRKLDFLNAKQDDRAIYNPHGLQQPVSPYEVLASTLISASLVTGLNSDLPGLVIAQVTEIFTTP